MEPVTIDLAKWVAEFGVTAAVLVFVLVRLERAVNSLTDSYERHAAWLEAWVQAHTRGTTGPAAGMDVRAPKP